MGEGEGKGVILILVLNINGRLDRTERSSRHRKLRRQVVDISDSESDTESEEEPLAPVKSCRKRKRKPTKAKEEKKEDKKINRNVKFKKGDDYKLGMERDKDWENEVKNAFKKAPRQKYQQQIPEEGKQDYIKMFEDMLTREKER